MFLITWTEPPLMARLRSQRALRRLSLSSLVVSVSLILGRNAHPDSHAGGRTDANACTNGHTRTRERTNADPHGDRRVNGLSNAEEGAQRDGNPYLRGNRRSHQRAIAQRFWSA